MFQISLAAARVNAGYKQKDAAHKLGITEKTLGGYERGQTSIPGHVLQKAAKLYDISSDNIRLEVIDDGVFDEDEKNLKASTF